MADLRCPECGGSVDVRAYHALHRWPLAYPDDARSAVIPCEHGDPVVVGGTVLLDDGQPAPVR